VTTAIPISEAVPTLKPGVYAITAAPETSVDEWGPVATQWFVVSDLGVTALSGNDGVHVIVRSLSSAKPVAGAKLRLVATNDDILGEAISDENGYARFEPGLARGKGGAGSNMTGAGGKDLVIKVPVGTQILADDEDRTLLADFTVDGQRLHFLKGGDGGRGNASYKTSTNRAPRQHGTGWPGEEMYVWLRLKLLADVGLVGLPNAGKSTFINAVTNAQAKVGAYAFTTLRPQLGVVSHKGREFVIADIPGLIEGAAEGAGVGDRFLGHIERCEVLLHLVDANDEDVATSYRIVRDELDSYGAGLADKPVVVALNKVDTLDDELIEALSAELAEASGLPVLPLSAAGGTGIEPVLDQLLDRLGDAAEEADELSEDARPWSPL